MAFNWQTFRTRSLTAAVFVVVMLVGLLWNRWSFFVLFSIVQFGAWKEYQELVSKINPNYKKISAIHRYGIMIAGWCILFYFTRDMLISRINLSQLGFWAGVSLMVLLPLVMFLESKPIYFRNILYSFSGLIYISLPLGLLISLRMLEPNSFGEGLSLLLIFSLWINDTMAYVVGSVAGKTPLSKISPKKTWEGTVGGIILCVLVMIFVGKELYITVTDSIFISAIAAITGTFGDLFESKLKRMAGVKDSGSIMPGHGGFLDRFDSLLFASVFVWIYVNWFR